MLWDCESKESLIHAYGELQYFLGMFGLYQFFYPVGLLLQRSSWIRDIFMLKDHTTNELCFGASCLNKVTKAIFKNQSVSIHEHTRRNLSLRFKPLCITVAQNVTVDFPPLLAGTIVLSFTYSLISFAVVI